MVKLICMKCLNITRMLTLHTSYYTTEKKIYNSLQNIVFIRLFYFTLLFCIVGSYTRFHTRSFFFNHGNYRTIWRNFTIFWYVAEWNKLYDVSKFHQISWFHFNNMVWNLWYDTRLHLASVTEVLCMWRGGVY